MDSFKLDNFVAANPGTLLPIRSCQEKDVAGVRERLAAALKIADCSDGRGIAEAILRAETVVSDVSALKPGFDFGEVVRTLVDVQPEDAVLLNWHHFEQLDRIRFADLARYFEDIWYPAVDDLDVLSEDTRWVVSISHFGTIGVAKLA
ncbi:MAG: hypothetical protein ACKVPX_03045 [Myxococcaceae bacterium]